MISSKKHFDRGYMRQKFFFVQGVMEIKRSSLLKGNRFFFLNEIAGIISSRNHRLANTQLSFFLIQGEWKQSEVFLLQETGFFSSEKHS